MFVGMFVGYIVGFFGMVVYVLSKVGLIGLS